MRAGWMRAAMVGATLFLPSMADAQTKTPNSGSPIVLRQWPQIGVWQTALFRREDQRLACGMFSGRADAGRLLYLAGVRQLPDDLSLSILDSDWSALSGDQIALVIDGVQVGNYPITKRINDKGVYRSILATIPKSEWQRVISLFRTGETVRFVTAASTFTFPLNGAAGSLLNMQNCIIEAANLQPG
jgi:hypothetical protein